MNPFLERSWADVHTVLIGYVRDAIASGGLPEGLRARVEERLLIDDEIEGRKSRYVADAAVVDSWKAGVSPSWNPAQEDTAGLVAAKPMYIYSEPVPERWIEISTAGGTLVTAVEILSPVNKDGPGREHYLRKQRDYLLGGVNLVEVDLLRQGRHTVRAPEAARGADGGTWYAINVHRAANPGWNELYAWSLRDAIPVINIPLRETDHDVPLALQPLINRCYEMGYYWQDKPVRRLDPPLEKDESDWVQARLVAAGLA